MTESARAIPIAGPQCTCGAPIPDPRMSFCASCLRDPQVQAAIRAFTSRVEQRRGARAFAREPR